MQTYNCCIKGTSPLLIHRYSEAAEGNGANRRIEVKARDPRKEAERAAYIAPDGTFYFSAFALPNALGAAGSSHKMTGSRKTLRFVVPSAVRMGTDTVTILDSSGKAPAKAFEVDSRPVTIPATKGRIMRHRPRWNAWTAKFQLHVNEQLISGDTVGALLAEAGQTIGIGDFRPEKRGPFGCFIVQQFEVCK